MEDSHKQTPLHEWHMTHGATMVEFSGWNMPLWYPAGAVAEHRAVITQSGIFDTSHMAVVSVSGAGSFDMLQLCFTRDLTSCSGKENRPLTSGECVYGAFLNDSGELIDDAN